MDSMNRIAQYEKIAVQKEVMPAASAQTVGKVYQYVGETTGTLTKGMFYEVVQSGSGYTYQLISILPEFPSNPSSNVTYTLKATYVDGTWSMFWEQEI